jgi:hypothetical protein
LWKFILVGVPYLLQACATKGILIREYFDIPGASIVTEYDVNGDGEWDRQVWRCLGGERPYLIIEKGEEKVVIERMPVEEKKCH